MMTDLAVSTRATAKTANGAIKAGGAGAQAGVIDGLEGAFAAIMTAAGKADPTGIAATGEVLTATKLPGGKSGKQGLPMLDVTLDEGGIQVGPDVKTADDAGVGAFALALRDGAAKSGKEASRPKAADVSPDQPAVQMAAAVQASAPEAVQLQAVQLQATEPTIAPGGDGMAIDGKARGKAAVSVALADRQPDVEQPQDAVKPQAVAPLLAAVPSRAEATPAVAPVAVKTEAAQPQPQQVAQIAAQQSEADGRQQAESGASGDERRQTADIARAATASVQDGANVAAPDQFRTIIESLPPVVQSQLGVEAASGPVVQLASAGELLNNQVIDMSVSGQWIDRMAREIAGLAEGSGHSRFQLMPPNLGRIQVDIWAGDDQTNVRLLTETDDAARRLREGQAALEASARLASLSLGSVSVEKSAAPLDTGRDPANGQNQRQPSENGGNSQQQASAQAHGESSQNRGNARGANAGGFSAVMGFEPQAESEAVVRASRADDPRVRFA